MATKAALAIRDKRAQEAAQNELSTQTKLLIAICEHLGIDVRKVLSGTPVEAVEPSEVDDPMAGAKAFKAASSSKK